MRQKCEAGFIYVRRKKFQAETMAFKDVKKWVVKPFSVRQDCGHKFSRIIMLKPSRLIRLDTVSRAMRLAEGVAGKTRDEFPHFGRLFGAVAASFCRSNKLAVNFLDHFPLLLGQRTPQNVGATGRQSRKRFADLQNMFLIDNQAIGAFQAWFQRRMRIDDRLHALITPREREFLSLVSRTRTDDTHNCHQPVDFPDITHPAKAGHGRAFDMMDRTSVAARNHFPYFGVLPRINGLWVTK